MIRAGVDDRGMLAASGVNVQLRVRGDLRDRRRPGRAGRRGRRHGAVDLAGRGHALPAGLARRRDRRRHGQRRRRGDRRAADRPGRAVRPGLRADLQRRLHLRDHGGRAGVPAARDHGEGRHERGAVAAGDELGGDGRGAGAAARRAAPARRVPAPRQGDAAWLQRCRRIGCATSSCSSRARLSVRRLAVLHLPDRRPVARARPDRAVAHLPRRLRRHGVAGADDGRRPRRLPGRDLRHQQHRRRSAWAGRGGWRSPFALVARDAVRRRRRLALGAHRGHLHDHDHARDRRRLLLPRAAELHRLQRLPGLQPGSRRRRSSASTCASRCRSTSSRSACALAGYFFVKLPGPRAVRRRAAGHPRQPAPHARARLQRHRAPGRRLCGGRPAGRGRRRADGLVQRPHLARHRSISAR